MSATDKDKGPPAQGARVEGADVVATGASAALAEALDDLHRYSLSQPGYAGSPCEAKVRAALEAVGRAVV